MNELIELNSLDTQSDEVTHFSRNKIRRFRILTFLSFHYYKIILYLFATVVLLLGLIIILLATVNFGSLTNISTTQPAACTTSPDHDRLHHMLKHNTSELEKYRHELESKEHALTNWIREIRPFSKLACRSVNCSFDPCNITEINFHTVKLYSCCRCITVNDEHLELLSYEGFLQDNYHALVLNDTFGVCAERLLLKTLPQLHCLRGTWDVVNLTNLICRLYYSIVGTSCSLSED